VDRSKTISLSGKGKGCPARPAAFLLARNMFVAYLTADRETLASIFSEPGKFYVADPYTFLFASLMVSILGAGVFCSRYVSGKAD
jgi:putative oxidoreductase